MQTQQIIPFPGSPDGKLPTTLQNTLEPLETLTFVAAKTDKIVRGMCNRCVISQSRDIGKTICNSGCFYRREDVFVVLALVGQKTSTWPPIFHLIIEELLLLTNCSVVGHTIEESFYGEG